MKPESHKINDSLTLVTWETDETITDRVYVKEGGKSKKVNSYTSKFRKDPETGARLLDWKPPMPGKDKAGNER